MPSNRLGVAGSAAVARARPSAAFSSSTAPQASSRGWLLETRRLYISALVPLSPVLVTMLISFDRQFAHRAYRNLEGLSFVRLVCNKKKLLCTGPRGGKKTAMLKKQSSFPSINRRRFIYYSAVAAAGASVWRSQAARPRLLGPGDKL